MLIMFSNKVQYSAFLIPQLFLKVIFGTAFRNVST